MDQIEYELMRELATSAFRYPPATFDYQNRCIVSDRGRLFEWSSDEQGFHYLLPIPQMDGGIVFEALPTLITDKRSYDKATNEAYRRTNEVAPIPSRSHDWGFVAEKIWVSICIKLGFTEVESQESDLPFSVRLGTFEEDNQEKADIVFFIPDENNNNEITRVPLQLTLARKGGGSSTKRKAIREGSVAYISLSRFIPQHLMEEVLESATTGNEIALWYAGEILKGALEKFLGRHVFLPRQPYFQKKFIKDPFFVKQIQERLSPELLAYIAGWKLFLEFSELDSLIVGYVGQGKLILDPSLFDAAIPSPTPKE